MSRYPSGPTLARLKDFQRRTVDYVFRRLYLDDPPTTRFLVADEVGLGKTMVARGVIARALEHLDGKVDRIDVVYVCSNAAIAHQNVSRLNVLGKGDFALASRLTLLPTQVGGLRKNPVNFVSFTPGTTFDLKSRSGTMYERSVIYRILREGGFDQRGLLNLLQGPAGRDGWKHAAKGWEYPLDVDLAEAFRKDVLADPALKTRVDDVCDRFQTYRPSVRGPDNEARYRLVGDLRQRLARVCLDALQPDLIVLDEFQRFRNLLRHDDPTAELAQALFRYPGARVLLLSATPYKMLSLDHEQEDDHYPDFLKTLRFLLDDDAAVKEVEGEIQAFRRELLELDPARTTQLSARRDALAGRLRAVMCRTERVAHTARQDAMVSEPPRPAPLVAKDLRHAGLIDGASRQVRARDAVEYWKSAPYALQFMKGYELRRNVERLTADEHQALAKFVQARADLLVRGHDFASYDAVDPANARLRSLFADTLEPGLWRLLWLPPSLPYWKPEGAYAASPDVTKALVFSAWNVVPDAIAALLSYEAERRAVQGLSRDIEHAELYERLKPLLRFSKDSEGRHVGMPALLLQYPSPGLAAMVDPVEEALRLGDAEPPTLAAMLAAVQARVTDSLAPILAQAVDDGGREDERWYWAASAMLDAARPRVRDWCASDEGWRRGDGNADEDPGASYREHVSTFHQAMLGTLSPRLGRPPADLARVLAELALAGPAICAARALRRVARELDWDDPALLSAAAQVGAGFRTLFNIPETIAILRGEGAEASYWRLALRHGLEGNLPALLDEQVHVLLEGLGLVDRTAGSRARKIAAELRESLSVRTSQLHVDELDARGGKLEPRPFKLRCRFALRFGELKDEKTEARVETVRSAFNSPFRPFVLASTSVGQEGLDFHVWCHAVVHWNLPSNPVDLEQREGRVHRYKGHAVRKNVAKAFGLAALRERWAPGEDPWAALFVAAREQRAGDLLAFWLFETPGGARIERRVPLLPLSREAVHLARLKRGLALYRLVFGQPRQEDLIAHLSGRLQPAEIERAVAEWRIDLTPPELPG